MSTISLDARADIWYGVSSVGKTVGIGELAEREFERTGKITRLVTSDGGSGAEGGVLDAHVKSGMIEIWPIGSDHPHPVEAWDLAVQGYWPDQATQKYTKKGLERVGFYAFEGLSSAGDSILAKLRRDRVKLSQDPSYSFKDGETTFSGANESYYGFVQDRVYDLVMKSHRLPIDGTIVWTSLEGTGEDKMTKSKQLGPAIAGKKSIGKCPQWFRRCLHLEQISTEKGLDENKQIKLVVERICYLKPHADPDTRLVWPVNPRIPKSGMDSLPEFVKPLSMKAVYDLIDKANAGDLERLKKMMAARQATVAQPQPVQ